MGTATDEPSLDGMRQYQNKEMDYKTALSTKRPVDALFALVYDCLQTLFDVDALKTQMGPMLDHIEDILAEHHVNPEHSYLSRKCPGVQPFYTPLPLVEAFKIYDRKYRITCRQHIPPTENEVRHIFNVAQIVALGREDSLRLLTFDGDCTLYADGQNFDNLELAECITFFLSHGVAIALVTAAGYEYNFELYEERIQYLLDHFKDGQLEEEYLRNFFVFGGESNYLMRANKHYRLEAVDEKDWVKYHSVLMRPNFEVESEVFLTCVEKCLWEVVEDLHLRCSIKRKKRAVGLVPGGDFDADKPGSGRKRIREEALEEAVARVHAHVAALGLKIPYCAFNGGRDVWVDVGNKGVALKVLGKYLNIHPWNILHVGDQFQPSGNDLSARQSSTTVHINNPEETKAVLRALRKQIGERLVSSYQNKTQDSVQKYIIKYNMDSNSTGSVRIGSNSPMKDGLAEESRRAEHMRVILNEIGDDEDASLNM